MFVIFDKEQIIHQPTGLLAVLSTPEWPQRDVYYYDNTRARKGPSDIRLLGQISVREEGCFTMLNLVTKMEKEDVDSMVDSHAK